jgi:dolichol kinase
MLVVPLIFIIVLSIQRNAIKKNPLLMDKRGIKSFVSLFKQKENVLNKPYHDLMRKLFHAIPSLMIMIIWVTCSIIGQPELRMPLILTTGYAGLTAFAFLDFIRLSFINNKKVNHLLPDSINKLLARVIKEQELYEPLKVAPLILAMIPILFFPFPVFFSMMLIATISDGMASVTGHYFGKKKFPANSNKTIVGYFAGAITSFILVIISFSLLSTLLINKIILIGLVGTAAFFITDFVNMRIDDNILNPLISGLVIGLTYLFS